MQELCAGLSVSQFQQGYLFSLYNCHHVAINTSKTVFFSFFFFNSLKIQKEKSCNDVNIGLMLVCPSESSKLQKDLWISPGQTGLQIAAGASDTLLNVTHRGNLRSWMGLSGPDQVTKPVTQQQVFCVFIAVGIEALQQLDFFLSFPSSLHLTA